MEASKTEQMAKFWSERARQYAADPRANTNDVWLREVEIAYVSRAIQEGSAARALDFGCANGFSTRRLAQASPSLIFLGVDINSNMIDVAQEQASRDPLPNLSFRCTDILNESLNQNFDFIYTIRVFQNMESIDTQKRIFDRLFDFLEPGGLFLYIESYLDGYLTLNEDRQKLDLPALPIHPHLTLLTQDFDNHVAKKMKLIKTDFLSSSYYFITRLVYSYMAKINNEEIDYNHALHQIGAIVPQIGNYGPQRASLYIKA